jgi:hypothetical protein
MSLGAMDWSASIDTRIEVNPAFTDCFKLSKFAENLAWSAFPVQLRNEFSEFVKFYRSVSKIPGIPPLSHQNCFDSAIFCWVCSKRGER